jgi:DNA-binding NtrC family response regulator
VIDENGPGQIVCVDDQPEVRELLSEIFGDRGKKVYAFAEGADALAHLRSHAADVALVLLDLDLGPTQPDGLHFLREIHADHPYVPTVILTGKGSVETAVEAVKEGAADFIEKDTYLEDKLELSVGKLERMLALSRERDELEQQNRSLQRQVEKLTADRQSRYTIIGDSGRMRQLLERVVRVAPVPRPVLILGERGTGKELVAHAIHRASPRADEPFVVMNCGAVPETLLESELFGHEKGAFTGATSRKAGKFELADGGTLFLDEIGNMSVEFQIKILRVLEYQRFSRVAGQREIEVDVRVIAATNADLQAAIAERTFRADLYDRLAFEVLELPPLRDRKSDILGLAAHFAERFAVEIGGLRCRRIGKEAAAVLAAYDFPGNVRELKSVVERAVYLADNEELTAADIEAALPRRGRSGDSMPAPGSGSFGEQVEGFERQLLIRALAENDWSQKDAAERLELTYDQFRHMYRKYGLAKLRDGD